MWCQVEIVGSDAHGGQGMGGQLQIARQQPLPAEEAGDVGLHADGVRIHAQQEVVHGGVGADAKLQNGPGIHADGLTEVRHDGHQSLLDDGILELFLTAGAALLDDAVDDIRAVADLAVAAGALGEDLAALPPSRLANLTSAK